MIYDDLIRQLLLGATGVVFLAFALWTLVKADAFAAVLGYKLDSNNSVSEFHAIYLGVFVAQAILCAVAVLRVQDALIGDIVAIFLLSQPAGRVIAAIKRGWPSGLMALLFGVEIVAGLLVLGVRPTA